MAAVYGSIGTATRLIEMVYPYFRYSKSGRPVLSKDEIDFFAEQLLVDFSPASLKIPSETDVDRLASRYLGLNMDYQYLSHCGLYLGMTVFKDTNRIPVYDPDRKCARYASAKAGTIIIDNSLLTGWKEHRYRFTVAHESGHAMLHDTFFNRNHPGQLSLYGSESNAAPAIQCLVDESKAEKKPLVQWNDYDWMEWQADNFSAAILMPRSMMIELVKSAPQYHPAGEYNNYLVSRVQRVFNVSCKAAELRLKRLGLIAKDALIDPYTVEYIQYTT